MKPSSLIPRRKSSTPHYQTFPTTPPTTRGRPPSGSPGPPASQSNASESDDHPQESPLPKKQLAMLAFIALAEQTALNSISPYLPAMASSFPEVKEGQVGLYVGLIASSFALAQFATNFFWGWLSDRIGRKPVILTGTLLTAIFFVAFGFSRTLWQAILVQVLIGLGNGNQGVVSTCLGEITDRSNQSKAFTYLPVVYGIGGITGPVIGGLLVFKEIPFHPGKPNPYPYLAPNLFAAAFLLLDFFVAALWLDESLEEAQSLPSLGKRLTNLFAWLWQFTASVRPTYLSRMERRDQNRSRRSRSGPSRPRNRTFHSYLSEVDEDNEQESSTATFLPKVPGEALQKDQIFNRDTVLIMITYFIFQLANVSFNSLYPIFAQADPPMGRNLSPEEIGLSLGFAGIVTIIFQVGIFAQVIEKIGNKTTYRLSLFFFVVTFVLMPWVGYKDSKGAGMGHGKGWLWFELGIILIIRTIASVGGLTSSLLLITNSAPNHNVLGALNGLAQTLSAAGRAFGPFVSGSLFTAGSKLEHKGEALSFGIFGGIALVGFFLSFGIRSDNLEAQGWDEESSVSSTPEEDVEEEPEGSSENSALLRHN